MALIPQEYLNSVVSIGTVSEVEKGKLQFASMATGFMVGNKTGKSNDDGPLYQLYLVTNKHVFNGREEVWFRFNTKDDKSHHFKVKLLSDENTPLWSKHSNDKVDLAVLPVSAKAIADANIDYYFFTDSDTFYAKDFASKNISTGDGLFVLGFPMSISGKAKNFVILRQGIIARVDEEVLEEGYFYIDASAYPGNSGGPVIVKPEVVFVGKTGSNNRAGLIGVISAGETYKDIAVSKQTGEPKVIFTEQTGLVRIIPAEFIYEIIENIVEPATKEVEIEDASSEVSTEETSQKDH